MMLVATITPLRALQPQPELPSRRERLTQVAHGDAELVKRLRSGDEWAKEALYRRYFPSLWHMVLRLLGNSAEAEDVVHDAFVIALQDVHRLRDEARFGPWLMQIAVRQVHRRFRRRKVLRTLGLTWGVEDATLDGLARGDCCPEVRTELAKIAQLLALLPTHQRIAWMLRHVDGCALEEIAERTGASLATVKRRIAAVSDRVRKHVAIDEGAL
jgi:RNA polymerase sigma-70 factor (ECF subfamily)